MPGRRGAKKTKIERLVGQHEEWRARCINLMASENMTSPAVRALLSSDLGHRYTLPVHGDFEGIKINNAYRGTKYTDQVEEETEALARKVFRARYASVNPLSGHLSAMTMMLACCRRGDRFLATRTNDGGYHGYCKGFMPDMLGLRFSPLPFRRRDWDLDYEGTVKKIRKSKPALVVLGISYFPFPYDMGPVREACEEAGSILGYDASHVLGLVAGGQFQDPLADGARIMVGSTHKTFPGPQGGIVVTNDGEIHGKVRENLTWRTEDNAHWNRIAALGLALAEMKAFGKAYARQVVANAGALARAMDEEGLPVRFKHRGFTRSHQVMLDTARLHRRLGKGFNDLAIALEREGIIVDAVGRMGAAEVTRMGMKEDEMTAIAGLIADVIIRRKRVRKRVESMARKCSVCYSF